MRLTPAQKLAVDNVRETGYPRLVGRLTPTQRTVDSLTARGIIAPTERRWVVVAEVPAHTFAAAMRDRQACRVCGVHRDNHEDTT